MINTFISTGNGQSPANINCNLMVMSVVILGACRMCEPLGIIPWDACGRPR